VGGVDGEDGFADAGHATEADDGDGRGVAAGTEEAVEAVEEVVAAGEGAEVGGEGEGGRRMWGCGRMDVDFYFVSADKVVAG